MTEPFETPFQPPGFGSTSKPERGTEWAALLMFSIGGLLLVLVAVGLIGLSAIANLLDIEDDPDAIEVRSIRNFGAFGAVVVAAPFVVAGSGLMYRAPFGRGWTIGASILSLILLPFFLLGLISLVLVARGAGRLR